MDNLVRMHERQAAREGRPGESEPDGGHGRAWFTAFLGSRLDRAGEVEEQQRALQTEPAQRRFDCVARWIGKGIISDDAPIDVEALKRYPYIVGDEVDKDEEGRYLINVAPSLRPYVQEPEVVGRGTVELDDVGVAESKGD